MYVAALTFDDDIIVDRIVHIIAGLLMNDVSFFDILKDSPSERCKMTRI